MKTKTFLIGGAVANPHSFQEFERPGSDGAVWMLLTILILTTMVAGYFFWARITGAWPFTF